MIFSVLSVVLLAYVMTSNIISAFIQRKLPQRLLACADIRTSSKCLSRTSLGVVHKVGELMLQRYI